MKRKNTFRTGKLALNKTIITNLSQEMMDQVKGGGVTIRTYGSRHTACTSRPDVPPVILPPQPGTTEPPQSAG
jgi:hypothetical protein